MSKKTFIGRMPDQKAFPVHLYERADTVAKYLDIGMSYTFANANECI